MNGRLYDPVIGRFFSPDPYVPNANNSQDFNRYSYARNNPLMYTDPDGEWIQYAIGGVLGGINGYMIGKSQGKTGWNLFGYTIAGAGIGVATAGVGTYATSFLGAMQGASGAAATIVGGSFAGGINSIGFSALSGNWDYWYNGFITGAAGSAVSGYFGGGVGAFLGGATSSSLGSFLSGEKNGKNIALAGLAGGLISWGSYEATTAIGYYKSGLKKEFDITYKEFRMILKATQQSFFFNREYSVTSANGKLEMIIGDEDKVKYNIYKGAKFSYHTHQEAGCDGFSRSGEENDICSYYEAVEKVGNYINLLGTREGNLWIMKTPFEQPQRYNFNFNKYFYPFHLYMF